jgi:putative spermidine/putrescine transport system permease protein
MTSKAFSSERRRIFLALIPALGLILLLYLGGLILAGIQSLGYIPAAGLTNLSLHAYRSLFRRPDFLSSLWLTAWVSIAATVISSFLAVGAALLLHTLIHHREKRRRWISVIFQLNLPIPHAVGAIAILLLFSQSGLLARISYALNLITEPSEFPELVFDRYGLGIILEYLWKTTVFTGVTVLAALESTSDEFEASARSLGANAFQRFVYVTFPLIRPALVSASILVFSFTFGGYEVPLLLGQRSVSMLPVLAYREYSRVDLASRPQAMAISLLITGIISCMVWIYMRFMEDAPQ